MKSTVLYIEGLTCAHCAEKINNKLGELDCVEKCNLDYINKRINISHNDKNIVSTVQGVVDSIEDGVTISIKKKSGNEEEDEKKEQRNTIIRLAISLVIFGVSFFLPSELATKIVAGTAFLLAGYDVLFSAVKNILKRQPFDETLLMTVASIGAICIGEISEGAAVMIFFQVGELFQDIAVKRSRKSITKLLEFKSDRVFVKVDGKLVEKDVEKVEIGDTVVLKPGERLAIDGVLVNESATFDMSALTGESLPVTIKKGEEVLSGSVSIDSALEVRATKKYDDSAIAQILEMVQNASTKKSEKEKFITKFARIYTPVVVLLAFLVFLIPTLITGFTAWETWLYRGLEFLVVSCPCALVISVPLSYFSGLGGASRKGILIKGTKNIESLAAVRTVAFDKTGTLTEGKFDVLSVEPKGVTSNELLRLCSYAESISNHPIAKALVNYYAKEIDNSKISNIKEVAGHGIKAVIDGYEILCGNEKLLKENGIENLEVFSGKTVVYVAKNGEYIGLIELGDKVKDTSKSAIAGLKQEGIQTALLTGDKKSTADIVAKDLSIDKVYSELLPAQKVEMVEQLIKTNKSGTVAFVGDGINDAPVIARADIGIAMGGIGSDIAVEAADIVLMNDDPRSIKKAVKIARKTKVIVNENIWFSIGIKMLIMVLITIGIADMWEAVFADVGVSVIAILNSLRALRSK